MNPTSETLQAAIHNFAQQAFIDQELNEDQKGRALNYIKMAEAPLSRALARLEIVSPTVAKLLEELYPPTTPYYIKSGKKNPVHHIAHVLDFMSEIMIGEKVFESDLNFESDLKIGMIAALFHDVGLGDSKLPKITEKHLIDLMFKLEVTKEDIRDFDRGAPQSQEKKEAIIKVIAFKNDAVKARREHMEIGEGITKDTLSEYIGEHPESFTDFEVAEILRIVANHDNPKIPILDSIIGRSLDPQWFIALNDPVMQFHREADGLWMVSEDGIDADLARFDPNEIPTPQSIVANNVHLHHAEADLYKEAFDAGTVREYGFSEGTLYRSKTGYAIFERLTKELNTKFKIEPSAIPTSL